MCSRLWSDLVWAGAPVPLSIMRHGKDQRQMARSTHTLSFCLSVHSSQSHTALLKAWERQLFFTTSLKKAWGTDSSKCDTLTWDFLQKKKNMPCETNQQILHKSPEHTLTNQRIRETHFRERSAFCIYIAFKYMEQTYKIWLYQLHLWWCDGGRSPCSSHSISPCKSKYLKLIVNLNG